MNVAARYALGLGDDALVLSQRLCEWATRAPAIEEDIALMNIALDLLGQARSLLSLGGSLEGRGRTEDDLAYLRQERDFYNFQLVELENGDFATTVARQLLFSAYQYELYQVLSASSDAKFAAIATKAAKEVAYHRDHAAGWVARLGDGTDESHARMEAGVREVWPYADEVFRPDPALTDLIAAGTAPEPGALRAPWLDFVGEVLVDATLAVPSPAPAAAPGGGRQGIHTEPFGYLLAEMQYLHRSYPGATW
ncbi:MAG: 1,2-phenylacetyl-CoA epoxidase subunit PaaC [Acidimicrobiales bacterium]